jgi:osmotically-inducible protein OsmY
MIMKSISSKASCIVLTTVSLISFSFSVSHAAAAPDDVKNLVASGETPTTKSPAPDNSAVNARKNGERGLTAEQQSNTRSDVKLTAAIRQALVKDKQLSTYAHNVKIITEGGQVVLKGPVKNQAEKLEVEKKAGQIAGVDRVRSELEVAR